MCGIVGYTGTKQAGEILLDGLEKLEYRGYDSSGIAVSNGEHINVKKATGRLEALREKSNNGKDLPGTLGIGHTRWATHGKPTELNSHPHMSENGRIAIVHNGIIENFEVLKEMLQKRGRKFISETDTEVVAQLIDYHYQGDIVKAVSTAMLELKGSYALGIICADEPDKIVAVKNHAPLIVAYGEDGNYFASDVLALTSHSRTVSYLEDNEIALIDKNGIRFFTTFLDEIAKEKCAVEGDVAAADKCGYEHYMIKEIMEQPEALKRIIEAHVVDGKVELSDVLTADYVKQMRKVFIVACGSSYNVGVVAKYNIEKLARIPVEVILASEFRYCNPIVDEKTLTIFISQSGETADTLEALIEAKRLGAMTLAIVNVEGSSIAKAADKTIYTKAGPEIAVATTKAYSTQLIVMLLIALYIADVLGKIGKDEYDLILKQVSELHETLNTVLEKSSDIQQIAYRHFNNADMFFMGRNIDYALSLEGSLKLKEISYIHSEAYPAGELKHGTMSLVVDGTLFIAVATCGRLVEKTVNNALEVKARGADVVAICSESLKGRLSSVTDEIISVPDVHEALQPSLAVVPLQFFAYYIALYRGCDIDKPRNLAKSVTVE